MWIPTYVTPQDLRDANTAMIIYDGLVAGPIDNKDRFSNVCLDYESGNVFAVTTQGLDGKKQEFVVCAGGKIIPI